MRVQHLVQFDMCAGGIAKTNVEEAPEVRKTGKKRSRDIIEFPSIFVEEKL